MALQVSNYTVVNNSRQLTNITGIDATTAAAIGAGGVGGGGEQTFTAASAVSTGDIVGMRKDGKIQAMAPADTSGSAEEVSDLDGIYIGSSYQPQFSKMVFNHDKTRVLWMTAIATTSSYYSVSGYWVNGGTVASNGTITWGTKYQIRQISANPYGMPVIKYLPTDNNTWIVSTHGYSSNSNIETRAIQVSSSGSLTVGNAYSVASYNAYSDWCDVFPTGEVIVLNNASSGALYFKSLTVSGTTLTAGTTYSVTSNTTGLAMVTVNQNTGKFAISTQTSSGRWNAIGTVSGSTLSYTTSTISGQSWSASTAGMVWLSDTDFWGANSTISRASSSNVVTHVSTGNTPSPGLGVTNTINVPGKLGMNWDTYDMWGLAYAPSVSEHIVWKVTYNDGVFSIGLDPIQLDLGFENVSLSYPMNTYSAGTVAYAKAWYDSSGVRFRGDAVFFSDADFVNGSYVGIAKENISANSSGKIAVSGGTVSGLTGLKTGTTYKVNLSTGELQASLTDREAIATSSTTALLY